MTYGELNIDPSKTKKKTDRSSFGMIFEDLSNASFRFVLRRLGAELDGRLDATPTPLRGRPRKFRSSDTARVKTHSFDCRIELKHHHTTQNS